MLLSEINIYPIKSLRGITVAEARLEPRGLALDRRWMLVSDRFEFLTQRQQPKMAALGVSVTPKALVVTSIDSSICVPLSSTPRATIAVKIWSSRVKALVYGDEVNRWFSNALATPCRLVEMPETTKRVVNPFYAVKRFEDIVSFADGYPFLLATEASLANLNQRLDEPVPMNRFRPNFVVSGSDAFDEDDWKLIKIGSSIFHVVKPCARCVITTVDQSLGEKSGQEPLRTLAGFRTRHGKVLFGQNLIADNAKGVLRAGDKVEIVERHKKADR